MSVVHPFPALLGPQSNGPLGLDVIASLLDSELVRHHARVCALHKPELVAECHQIGILGSLDMPKATLQSRLLAYYRAQAQSFVDAYVGDGPLDSNGAGEALRSNIASGLHHGFFTSVPPLTRPA